MVSTCFNSIAVSCRHPEAERVLEQISMLCNMLEETRRNLRIIYVSFDIVEQDYAKFLIRLPRYWYTTEFMFPRRELIASMLEVSAIPELVIMTPTGQIISNNGRGILRDDPYAEAYPWFPPTLFEVIGNDLETNKQTRIDVIDVFGLGDHDGEEKGGIPRVAFFFGAQWSKASVSFSLKLKKAYSALRQTWINSASFHVVFVSLDKDLEAYNRFVQSHEYLTIGFNNPRAQQLSNLFEVEGIPSVVIVDRLGEVLSSEASIAVMMTDPAKCTPDEFPWITHPLQFVFPTLLSPSGNIVQTDTIFQDHNFLVVFAGSQRFQRSKQKTNAQFHSISVKFFFSIPFFLSLFFEISQRPTLRQTCRKTQRGLRAHTRASPAQAEGNSLHCALRQQRQQ